MKKPKPEKPKFDLKEQFDSFTDFVSYIRQLDIQFIKTNKKVEYANVPCVIDIETSSFLDINGEKTAIMYCFTFGINGHSYFGRTYDDLRQIVDIVSETFNLSLERRMIFYIHNLGYEFQFFKKHFIWKRIFAIRERTPLSAITTDGIEFRCSFLLSGYSLEKTGENLQMFNIGKKVGDLDYSKIRHPNTPLTETELGYVLYDGIVVMCYIYEMICSHSDNITKIPLTKTGEIRKYCRNECLYGGGGSHKKSSIQYQRYRKIMNATRIVSVNEYKQLKRAFAGGFTHANGLIVGNEIMNVTSFDFTSSYPYVMVSEKFPMLTGELIEIKDKEDLMKNLNLYCCLFDVTFINIRSKIYFEHYLSYSHCRNVDNYRLDNGRIVDADELTTTITEQDYFIIEKCYAWDKMKIRNFRRYKRDYLPTPFVKSILELYKRKTELKGIAGKESEYLHSKELVNSCYGMSVTDICREEIEFDFEKNEWKNEHPEIDFAKYLNQYNNSVQRFLSYVWGIWVPAYARRNLWSGILEFKEDYLYSDTDSIKVIEYQKHKKYIDAYNERVMEKLKRAMEYHHLSMDYVSPRSVDGKVHTLGLWDNETPIPYKRFKTLGAKRYMVQFEKPYLLNKETGYMTTYSLTISGVNKKIAIPYLEKTYPDMFKEFKEDMFIPKGYTGKNIHTYIDDERIGAVRDYRGVLYEYHELSCIHMEESEYTLSLAREYVEFLLMMKMIEFD